MALIFVIISSLIFILLASLFWHLKQRNEYFKKLGIAGPKPWPLFGNLGSMTKKMMHEAFQEWTVQYGKTFGYYEGGTPVLVISDVDMLHEIFVKKFSQFNSRKALPIQPDPETSKNCHMFLARGQRWKRLRMISNPTFSASKLKAMTPTANDAVSLFMSLLEKKCKSEKPFDIYQLYQALTLDIIGRCAFGIKSDCQTNPNDDFLILCKEIFYNTMKLNWVQLCGILFPECPGVWMAVSIVKDHIGKRNPFREIEKRLITITEERRTHQQSKSVDLLQLLLDSEIGEKEEFAIENDQVRQWHVGDGDQPKSYKKLFPEEVVSTCILFLLAGYETTSVALAYTTYFLACNPEVQKKVQEEIDEKFNEEAPYEAMNKCIYLDNVISETLRLYPIATPVQARKCMETCVVGDLVIPKGLTIAADVWTIHHDQQIWGHDADKFRPERFSPEEAEGRHPMAWLPFGGGPRNCIGMRFALMEAKLTLCNVLKRYTFHTCPETEIPPKIQEGATTTPTNGVTIIIKERLID